MQPTIEPVRPRNASANRWKRRFHRAIYFFFIHVFLTHLWLVLFIAATATPMLYLVKKPETWFFVSKATLTCLIAEVLVWQLWTLATRREWPRRFWTTCIGSYGMLCGALIPTLLLALPVRYFCKVEKQVSRKKGPSQFAIRDLVFIMFGVAVLLVGLRLIFHQITSPSTNLNLRIGIAVATTLLSFTMVMLVAAWTVLSAAGIFMRVTPAMVLLAPVLLLSQAQSTLFGLPIDLILILYGILITYLCVALLPLRWYGIRVHLKRRPVI